MLLYCLGKEADDVLMSTNISTESRKKYSDVLAKFDTHLGLYMLQVWKQCGHFGTVCFSKSVAMLSEDPIETDPIEISYLNAVTKITKSRSKSMANQFHL